MSVNQADRLPQGRIPECAEPHLTVGLTRSDQPGVLEVGCEVLVDLNSGVTFVGTGSVHPPDLDYPLPMLLRYLEISQKLQNAGGALNPSGSSGSSSHSGLSPTSLT